jgi:hypothetical protein
MILLIELKDATLKLYSLCQTGAETSRLGQGEVIAIPPRPFVQNRSRAGLRRSLMVDAVSDIQGSPTRLERTRKVYWSDRFLIAPDLSKTDFGDETDELIARPGAFKTMRLGTDERRKQRTSLIRMLRAEGILGTCAATRIQLAVLAAAGVFQLGGTHALRFYKWVLGARYNFDQIAQTGGIDIVSPSLQKVLGKFSFASVPSSDGKKVWRWKQARNNLMVKFLKPSFQAEEGGWQR